ncbi:uncharacterized protein LOC127169219 isoform X3 [Labeo rohita]|uniref:uncharacterized protein LOC127169219 isoform X3 n=1 Tax=Labeo rohita TaxID=84645 RepID=UPI0021E348AC|nr:uncharacterized protein LOC127169219 isoform X3 [Labeo rohita]
MDTRTEDSVRCSKTNKKRHIQRMRSPLRYTRPYRPRFEGKNLRPRFFRTMEERFLRRPNFALRYQRHHTGQWSSLKLSRKTRASSPPNQQFDKGLNKNSPTAHTKPSSTDIPRLSSGDRSSLSFTVRDQKLLALYHYDYSQRNVLGVTELQQQRCSLICDLCWGTKQSYTEETRADRGENDQSHSKYSLSTHFLPHSPIPFSERGI